MRKIFKLPEPFSTVEPTNWLGQKLAGIQSQFLTLADYLNDTLPDSKGRAIALDHLYHTYMRVFEALDEKESNDN